MLTERPRAYLLADLQSSPEVLSRLLAGVTDPAVYNRRPDPARFTLREMIAHLADWEGVFLTRLTQTRDEDQPVLLGQDQSQLAIDHDYAHADPLECLARYAAGRRKVVAFLGEITAAQWPRIGTHTEIGPISLEEQMILIAAHDGYHRLQTLQWLAA